MEDHLRNASRDGDVKKVKELLENRADVNSVDEYGQTALHWASFKGQTEVVELLLKYNSSISTLDKDGRTGLHLAAMWGHTDTVKLLLSKQTQVNGQDNFGWTPLHLAVIRNFTDTVSTLLRFSNIDIDAKDNNGKTALEKAKRYGHMDVVSMLESYEQVHKPPDAKRRKADCDHAMSAEEIQEARIALRTGFVNLHLTKCVFIGPKGVGKTHTQKLLCGLPLPEARKSTDLLERPVMATLYFNGDQCTSCIVDSSIMLDFLSTRIKEFLNSTKCTKKQDLVVDKQLSSSLFAAPKMSKDSDRTQTHIRIVEEERLLYEKELLQRVSKLQTIRERTEIGLTTNWMICLDSGGQPQFHRLLHTFMNDLDVALYVLKLNEKLDDYSKIEWYNDGKLHGEAYSYSYTNEWMLKRTIQGLTAMRNPPSIVFVGTHRDLEHECDETIADKNTKLKSILLPNFKRHLLPYNTTTNDVVFPINCQCPGSEDNAVMVKLKAVISKRINSIPIRLKLSDLFLGLEIKALAERKGHSLVSIVDCLEIGNSLGLSQDEVNDAIKFLSNCNLLYYNAFVPDIVFCNLQSILSNITNFVKKTHELHDLTFETTELITHGQFRDDMIDIGLATDLFVDGLFCKHQYIDLLEHLGVISVIKDKPHKLYFMPSLLKEVSPLQLENVRRSCIGCAQPIILFYEKGWPTSGTYCTLVARLLSRDDWKITEKDSTPICLFSNCIQLSFLDKNIQGSCLITIIDCVQYIELNVFINGISNTSDEYCKQLYSNICPTVLRIVEHNLNGNTANGRVHTTFMCSCGKPATLILETGMLKCSRDDTITFLLNDREKVWQLY